MRKLVYGLGSALVLIGVLMTLPGSAQARRAANEWAGTWNTGYSTMVLTQTGQVTPPTQASCKPETFSMTDGSQHYPVEFSKFVPPDPTASNPYQADCIWVLSSDKSLAFTVRIHFQPPGTYGLLDAGNCGGSNTVHRDYDDGTNVNAYSQTRQLGVEGADRRSPWHVEGGNLNFVRNVLKAAEGEGVGLPCISKQQLQKLVKLHKRASREMNYAAAFASFLSGVAFFLAPPEVVAFEAVLGGIWWGGATHESYLADQASEKLANIHAPIQRSKQGRAATLDPRVRAAEQALSKDASRALTLVRARVKGRLSVSKQADTLRELASILRRQAGLRASLRTALAAAQPQLGRKLDKKQLTALRAKITSGALARSTVAKTRSLGLRPPSVADAQKALKAQLAKRSGKSFLQLLTDPTLKSAERRAASALTALARLVPKLPA